MKKSLFWILLLIIAGCAVIGYFKSLIVGGDLSPIIVDLLPERRD